MMHASNEEVLKQLSEHFKINIKRPVAGILGANNQAEIVINYLGLSKAQYSINSKEGLYELNLNRLNELSMPNEFKVVSAKDISESLLLKWMKAYDIEALGKEQSTEHQVVTEEKVSRLKKKDCWVLLIDNIPVSLCGFNARLDGMVQVGPVWTPQEQRNKGYAKILLSQILNEAKKNNIKKAILFTDNPAAIKAYQNVGFKKIGNYRLALLERLVDLNYQKR